MLVPPSAEWSEGPPAATATATATARPDPLPPELEARLRRQRAQQYGRAVRESLAATHARQAAECEAAAAEQREAWEAQRSARLARLAERQQAQQQPLPQRASVQATTSPLHQDGAKHGAPARAEGAENTSPATLLQAVEQLDAQLHTAAAASPRSHPGSSHPQGRGQPDPRQQQPPAPRPVMQQRRPAAGGAGRMPCTRAGSKADAARTGPGAELHGPVQHPAAAAAARSAVDPLEQLLQDLLAAEGGGDPYSIINLYVAEQLALQQAAAGAAAPAAPTVGAAVPAAQAGVAQNAAVQHVPKLALAGSGPNPAAVEPGQRAAEAAAQQEYVALAAAVQHLPAGGWEEALAQEPLLPLKEQPPPLKEQPSLKLQPSESAPSTARHRRSSSLMLPQQFDAAAAAEPAEWCIAAVSLGDADRQSHILGAGPGPAAGAPAAAPPLQPQAVQRQQSAAAAGIAPLEQGGSKALYVQQWLQRSAAELAAPESAPPASTAAYSEDPDQASAQLEALSSHASPDAGTALPFVPTGAATADVQPAPSRRNDAVTPAAAAAASPEAGAAAAPSCVSLSSRSASAVTNLRRPGAPEPPSSSSLLDGSSSAASRSRHAAATASAAVAAPLALQTQPEEHEPQATAEEQSLGSSSWDGRRGADSELPAALSFSQLQAVGVVDAAAVLPPAVVGRTAAAAAAAAGMDAEESSERASSRSSGEASPAGSAAHPGALAAVSPTAAAGPSATAAGPAAWQDGSPPSSQAYSSDFDTEFEDAEISYGDLGFGSSAGAPLAADAAAGNSGTEWQPVPPAAESDTAAAESSSRPCSPRVLQPGAWHAGGGSPPGSAGSQQRPRSPHHAALDDRYPGSPPASGGSLPLQLPAPGAAYSRPHSPASRSGSPRASGDGGVTSRPMSPGSAAGRAAAAAAVTDAPTLQQEDTVVVHSPAGSSSSASSSGGGQAGSPYSLVQFGTEPASAAAAAEDAAAAAGCVVVPAAAGSPPGTPVVASPGEDYGSCPGSARVDDDTVVQTEEHNRAYLQEVLDYFLRERAEAFAAGAAPYSLELDGYLAIERRRPACGDPQHIWNKLLFDAANEALAAHYAQAVCSLTGRLAPRVALLDPALLDRHVTQRVLRWATLGSGGAAGSGAAGAGGGGTMSDLRALLAEDAAEEERALGQLVGALHAELAAAASRAASPDPAGAAAGVTP